MVCAAEPSTHRRRVVNVSAVCLLDGAEYRTKEHVLKAAQDACRQGATDLVVLPFTPFLTFVADAADGDLDLFRKLARESGTYLCVALSERDGDRRYATSVLIDRQGRVAASWRKTHALPDDNMALGDELAVYETDFGPIAATIGTDIYFPEVYEVLRMKGADVLIWQHFPERFREHSGWDALLNARAVDSHCHLVAAHYADPRPYITNRYEIGMQGAAFGRSTILNRVGIPIADTGYEDGVAFARIDLDKRRTDPYKGWKKDENIFYVNVLADRKAFRPVAEPWEPPRLPEFKQRTARVAVIYMDIGNMWRNEKTPERLLALLDRAAEIKPDIVLASEQGASEDDATTQEAFGMIAARARKMRAYICIGGLRDEAFVSIARLWDRSGEMVWEQPIYWTKGFDTITYYDTDFARISTHTCGDLYAPFFDRTLALHGVELILDPSQMWGGCGRSNETLLRARSLDNAMWIACAHWNSSDPGLRSLIVDPYGQIVAASEFQREGVVYYDIDFSARRVYYEGRKPQQPTRGEWDIPSYYSEDIPEQKPGWREMILSRRRPELYGIIPTTNEVIMRYRPESWPK